MTPPARAWLLTVAVLLTESLLPCLPAYLDCPLPIALCSSVCLAGAGLSYPSALYLHELGEKAPTCADDHIALNIAGESDGQLSGRQASRLRSLHRRLPLPQVPAAASLPGRSFAY